MGIPSMPELIVILVIVLLIFGAKRIPDIAQGLGKGIKNFKNAIKDDKNSQDQSDAAAIHASEKEESAKEDNTPKKD